jgi:hypothetical protein
MSDEFKNATPRLQRPLFLFASMQRSAGVLLAPDPEHFYSLNNMGQMLYSWHTPEGHPITSAYWQSPGLIVRRWRSMMDVWPKIMAQSAEQEWPTIEEFANRWGKKLGVADPVVNRSMVLLRKELGEEVRKVSFSADDRWAAAQALSLLSASTEYQTV